MTQARRFQTQLGIGIESTWGDATAPTIGVPINDFKGTPNFQVILDNGLRGLPSKDFKTIQGAGHGEWSVDGMVYPEEEGYWLKMLLGGAAVTGSGPYTHTFSVAATPGSLCLEDDVVTGSSGGRQFAGAKVGQINYTWNAGDGVLMRTAQGSSMLPTNVTATNPSRTYDNTPWQGWRGVLTSSGIGTRMVSGELNIVRELEVVHTGAASQNPGQINHGPVEVHGHVIVVVTDLTDFTNQLAHLTQSFALVFDGAGSTKTLTFTMTNCNFADGPVELDRSKVGITYQLPFRGIHNSTDGGPIKVTLKNAKASYSS